MNNARIWLVVKPTIGVPVFLGAVAIGSFANHVAIVTNTTWVNDFLSGREYSSESDAVAAATETAPAKVVFSSDDPSRATVVLEDGRTLEAVLEDRVHTASLDHSE